MEFFYLFMYTFSIIWMSFMSLMFSAATEGQQKTNFVLRSFDKIKAQGKKVMKQYVF